MNPYVKTFINALIAALVGGGVPAVSGADWPTVIMTGVVAIIVALINLWQHKPNGPSSLAGKI